MVRMLLFWCNGFCVGVAKNVILIHHLVIFVFSIFIANSEC